MATLADPLNSKDSRFIGYFLSVGFELPPMAALNLDPLLSFMVRNKPFLLYYACLKPKEENLYLADEEFLFVLWFNDCKHSQASYSHKNDYWEALKQSVWTSHFFSGQIYPYMQLILELNHVFALNATPQLPLTVTKNLSESLFFEQAPFDFFDATPNIVNIFKNRAIVYPEQSLVSNYYKNAHFKNFTTTSNTRVEKTSAGRDSLNFVSIGNVSTTFSLRDQKQKEMAAWLQNTSLKNASPYRLAVDADFGVFQPIQLSTFKFYFNTIKSRNFISYQAQRTLTFTYESDFSEGPQFDCLTTLKSNHKSAFELYFCIFFLQVSPQNTNLSSEIMFNNMLSFVLETKNNTLSDTSHLRTEQCFLNQNSVTDSQSSFDLIFPEWAQPYKLDSLVTFLTKRGRIIDHDNIEFELSTYCDHKFFIGYDIQFAAEAVVLKPAVANYQVLVVNIVFVINSIKDVWQGVRQQGIGVDIKYKLANGNNFTPSRQNLPTLAQEIYALLGKFDRQDIIELIPGDSEDNLTLKNSDSYDTANLKLNHRYRYASVILDLKQAASSTKHIGVEFSLRVAETSRTSVDFNSPPSDKLGLNLKFK